MLVESCVHTVQDVICREIGPCWKLGMCADLYVIPHTVTGPVFTGSGNRPGGSGSGSSGGIPRNSDGLEFRRNSGGIPSKFPPEVILPPEFHPKFRPEVYLIPGDIARPAAYHQWRPGAKRPAVAGYKERSLWCACPVSAQRSCKLLACLVRAGREA